MEFGHKITLLIINTLSISVYFIQMPYIIDLIAVGEWRPTRPQFQERS